MPAAASAGRLTGSRQARPARGCGLETRPRRDRRCSSRPHAGSSHGVSTSSTNAWMRSRNQVTTRSCLRFARPRWSSLSRPGDHVYGCLPAASVGRLTGSRQARPTCGCVLDSRSRRDPRCGSCAHAGSSHGVSTGSTNAWARSRDGVSAYPPTDAGLYAHTDAKCPVPDELPWYNGAARPERGKWVTRAIGRRVPLQPGTRAPGTACGSGAGRRATRTGSPRRPRRCAPSRRGTR
jgi:hypothetical protein